MTGAGGADKTAGVATQGDPGLIAVSDPLEGEQAGGVVD